MALAKTLRRRVEMRPNVLASILLLPGCTTIADQAPASIHTFVGVVRVKIPETRGRLTSIDVRSLGFGWSEGVYLGWRGSNWVVADPARCQLLIVIRSAAQAESTAKVIQSLGGQDACMVDFTHK